MRAREVGGDPALRRPVDEPEPEKERLVHVLDRLGLLGQDGRERRDPDRSGRELLDDRGQQLAIGRIEALVVDLHRPHRRRRGRLVDMTVAVDLGVIADALEQPVDDRGVPRPRRAIARIAASSMPTPRITAERSTIAARSSSV